MRLCEAGKGWVWMFAGKVAVQLVMPYNFGNTFEGKFSSSNAQFTCQKRAETPYFLLHLIDRFMRYIRKLSIKDRKLQQIPTCLSVSLFLCMFAIVISAFAHCYMVCVCVSPSTLYTGWSFKAVKQHQQRIIKYSHRHIAKHTYAHNSEKVEAFHANKQKWKQTEIKRDKSRT